MEDSDHGLLALLHPWHIFGVIVHAASDGGRPFVPIETVVSVTVIRVWCVSSGGVFDDTPPGAARCRMWIPRATSDPLPLSPPPGGES